MTRKAFFWIHLAAGLAAAVPVGVMALTGVLLAFQPQILAFAEAPRGGAAAAAVPAPSLDQMVARARNGRGEGMVSVRLQADSSKPVEVRRGRSSFVLLDRATGEVVGRSSPLRGTFAFVERIHRWLGSRELGGVVTGISTLLCLLLSATGLVLWWPRSLGALRHVAWPRRGLAGKARDWQWHNAVGVLALPFLFALSATGTVMAWPWAQSALYASLGAEVPRREGPSAKPPRGREAGGDRDGRWGRAEDATSSRRRDGNWQAWADTVLAHAPEDWETVSLSAPTARGKGAQGVFRAGGERGPTLGTVQLAPDGGFESWKPVRSDLGSNLKRWIRATHTGEILGLPGQILMALASAGTLLLAWTGVALSLRRWRRCRAHRAA